ncbi:MAG: L-threonylcarbamoyladenylate synthase [Actinobacteria bacterium]|nr:L-threonylcarbamoyladenylate synthase [Actinomycetota bacterium]
MSQLDDAVAALRRGEVVGIPTDTVYGIVTLPAFSDRLYEVKGRPRSLELPTLVADVAQARTLVAFTSATERLAERFWPGKLTIVVGGVGLRVPDHEVPRKLCRAVGPLASTSANPHGAPPCATADEVRALTGVSVVVDGGPCDGAASTVVAVDPFRVIREGAIAAAEVETCSGSSSR